MVCYKLLSWCAVCFLSAYFTWKFGAILASLGAP